MPVTSGSVQVNSGNQGWTNSDVMDALESVFVQVGLHGGTARNGVPVGCLWPGQDTEVQEEIPTQANGASSSMRNSYSQDYSRWGECSDAVPLYSRQVREFTATANGTSGYYMQESWTPTGWNDSNNTLTVPYNWTLQSEKEVVFIPSGGDSTNIVGGLTLNTSYWIIRVDETTIQLAATLADAQASNAIDLTAAPTAGWTSTTRLWDPQTGSENVTIETYVGDRINFITPGGMYVCEGNSYDSTKVLNATNFNAGNLDKSKIGAINSGLNSNGANQFTWDTNYNLQSEDNTDVESYDKPSTMRQGNVHQGWTDSNIPMIGVLPYYGGRVVEWCYASDTTSAMKGVVKLLPSLNTSATWGSPYWKVTIPGTVTGGGGSGKDLKLRVHRRNAGQNSTYRGHIDYIDVCNCPDGWSSGATFTISGADIGASTLFGHTTANYNVEFGTNTPGAADAFDGVASLICTNYGGTAAFHQKNPNGHFAVLKQRHDNAKMYGDSYYAFTIGQDYPYRMTIKGGAYWESQNCRGTEANPTSSPTYQNGIWGFMDGRLGLNRQGTNTINPWSTSNRCYGDFCNSTTPTSYPLEIKYWRPQAPQDTNFAIISFCQTIDGESREFWTFSLPTVSWGATTPGVDLDHLYLGHAVIYTPNAPNTYYPHMGVDITHRYAAYRSSTNNPSNEVVDSYTLTEEASYGYIRNEGGGQPWMMDRYYPNISVGNDSERDIVTYYRNSTYDGTHSSQNYYRPIKGLPLLNCFAPCPYYMSDDFVMIQVEDSPQLTEFRSGDTITVSGSEKYEVIVAGYKQGVTSIVNQKAGTSGGACLGMLFCARTVG